MLLPTHAAPEVQHQRPGSLQNGVIALGLCGSNQTSALLFIAVAFQLIFAPFEALNIDRYEHDKLDMM